MTAPEKRWWLRWLNPTDDCRPLHFPPRERILGWWCTAEGVNGSGSILVALVSAEGAGEATGAVFVDWPEALDVTCAACEPNYVPGDRFPLSDWMRERLEPRR